MSLQKIKNNIIKDLKGLIPELSFANYAFNISQLPSKKNIVIDVNFNQKLNNLPREFVIKIFKTKNIANKINSLKRLINQKILVPKILLFKNPYLVLEKISGYNLSDFVNENLRDIKEIKDLKSEILNKVTQSIEKLAE